MDYEKWLLERYRSALQDYEIAQNHFKYCGPAFIDCAIDNLVHAERELNRIVKELRNGMGTKVSDD